MTRESLSHRRNRQALRRRNAGYHVQGSTLWASKHRNGRQQRQETSAPKTTSCTVRNSTVVSSGCRTFASFWPVEFSSGRLGASYCHGDGVNGLARQTGQIPRPCHLLCTVGPSARASGILITEK